MNHKKVSILSQFHIKQKNYHQFYQSPLQLFQYVNINNLPSLIEQKVRSVKTSDKNIVKINIYPQGYLICFYYSLIKLYFVNKQRFQTCLQIIYEILDNDDFIIQNPKNKQTPYYLDWSTSKIKRTISEYLNDILSGQYLSIDEIFQKNPQFNKILFLLSWSIMFDSNKVSNFEEIVSSESVKQILFEYFQINMYINENQIFIPDSSILFQCENNKVMYLINLPYQNMDSQMNTIESIQINHQKNQEYMDFKLNLDLNQTQDCQQHVEKSDRTKIFQDLTNEQDYNFDSMDFNNSKTTRLNTTDKYKTCNSPQNSNEVKRKFKLNQPKSKFIHQKSKFSHRNSQKKHEIDKLFELTSRKTTTQKSIYDDSHEEQCDEYSIIDQSIPTSKKITDKKSSKQNRRQFNILQSTDPQNCSLMNKWYQFCQVKKNKSQNVCSKVQKIKFNKKISIKNHIQQSNQKPDFRKVKSRRRKSQDMDENQNQNKNKNIMENRNNQGNQSLNYLQKIIENQTQHSRQMQIKRERQRQFIFQNPKKSAKNENIYSKFGYVNMNISQEFTDSIILRELDEKKMENIRMMKNKARQQRQTLRLKVQQQDKKAVKF